MSQYLVDHGNYLVSFGWDPPLSSFFARIEDFSPTAGPDEYLLDIGGLDRRYADIDEFAQEFTARLRDLGIDDFEFSEEQQLQLLADRDSI